MATKIIGENFPHEPVDQLMPAGGSRIGASQANPYGQNQYGGPSSLTPKDDPAIGKSGFLPGIGTPINDQLRKVKADQYPTTFGCKNPNRK